VPVVELHAFAHRHLMVMGGGGCPQQARGLESPAPMGIGDPSSQE
jgi:hypothetical protein